MWLRANIHNIKKPYDSRTWRTCKPWLSLRACKLEYRNYKNVSLGYMQIGNARLSDKEVRNAIAYEAKCQGRATTEHIQKDLEPQFDYDDKVIAPGKVLKRVNELRAHRGEQVLATQRVGRGKDTHTFYLKPKSHTELANIILKMSKPAETHTNKYNKYSPWDNTSPKTHPYTKEPSKSPAHNSKKDTLDVTTYPTQIL